MRFPAPRTRHLSGLLFAILILAGTVSAGPSATAEIGAPAAVAALQDIPVMEAPVEEPNWTVTSGPRHFVFDCADGYPGESASLADFEADCDLVTVYFCLEHSPWPLTSPKPGCDRPRQP